MNLPPRAAALSIRLLVRPTLAAPLPVAVQRAVLRAATVVGRSAPGVTRDVGLVGARPAEIHTPPVRPGEPAASGRAVLYLHGGAFTTGGPATHRPLCSFLAAATGARVYAVDYRRAPEHPYPAALDDALAGWEDLRARGIAAADLAIAGDSAGGWLALATALSLRDRGEEQGPLGLISPWVDLTVPPSPAGIADWDDDALLSRSWLTRSAAAYLAGTDAADPRVDLTTADLVGLPPTTLQVGTAEALLADARAVVGRLRVAGVEVIAEELPGLWHVSQAQAGTVASATAAVESFGAALWR